MKAIPSSWGTKDTKVCIEFGTFYPIRISGDEEQPPWFTVGDTEQLILNLQAALDTYKEHAPDTTAD